MWEQEEEKFFLSGSCHTTRIPWSSSPNGVGGKLTLSDANGIIIISGLLSAVRYHDDGNDERLCKGWDRLQQRNNRGIKLNYYYCPMSHDSAMTMRLPVVRVK